MGIKGAYLFKANNMTYDYIPKFEKQRFEDQMQSEKDMKNWLTALFILGVIIMLSAFLYPNPDAEETQRKVQVLDKMVLSADQRHKHHVEHITNLTLIVKEGEKVFSIVVNPATYYKAQPGKILYFTLSNRDVDGTGWGVSNGKMTVFVLGFGCIVFSFFLRINFD